MRRLIETNQVVGAAEAATDAFTYLGVTPNDLYVLINALPRTLRSMAIADELKKFLGGKELASLYKTAEAPGSLGAGRIRSRTPSSNNGELHEQNLDSIPLRCAVHLRASDREFRTQYL